MENRPADPAEVPRIQTFLDAHGWEDDPVERGELWGSFDGGEVVGTLRLIEAGPDAVYVASVLVREDRRGAGRGSELMRVAMATRPGSHFFLVCHPERVAFYQRLGYEDVPKESWPPDIVAVSRAENDFESDHDHLHHFMRRF